MTADAPIPFRTFRVRETSLRLVEVSVFPNALTVELARLDAMTPAERRADDDARHLREDARCAAEDARRGRETGLGWPLSGLEMRGY